MTTVLLTGFEPFDGATRNPSWEAVEIVRQAGVPGTDVHTRRLSVDFEKCGSELLTAIDEIDPDLIISVGLAGGSGEVRLERVAINVDDARIPDNAGNQPIDEPIETDGPSAYFTRLPVKACLKALQEGNVPAYVSNTAGTFGCNHIFYVLMHHLEQSKSTARGGFIHVPHASEFPGPDDLHLPLQTIADAISTAVTTTINVTSDIRLSAGALD